jgi:hypothetical protein
MPDPILPYRVGRAPIRSIFDSRFSKWHHLGTDGTNRLPAFPLM